MQARLDFHRDDIALRKSVRITCLNVCVVFLLLVISGCAGRPVSGALLVNKIPSTDAAQHDILIVTTRERDDRPGTLFNGERGEGRDFAEAVISVPPNHKPGLVEWPSTFPGNPETDFVTRQAHYIDGAAAMQKRLNDRLGALPPGKRTVFLFIHGYNTLFAEGLFRYTQIVHDSEFDGVPVLFTWASRGKVTDYVYDLNSALVARTALENTVKSLVNSRAEKIIIMAHSMGNWLLMETGRQLSPAERKRFDSKVESVVLASPDIDIDVFKEQLRRLGKPSKPFVIIVSRDDRALGLSRKIAGDKQRVGAYADDKELAELGAIVIDLTDLKSEDSAHHSKFAQLAQFGPQLQAIMEQKSLTHSNPGPDQNGYVPGQRLSSLVAGTARVAVTLPSALITAPVTLVNRDR